MISKLLIVDDDKYTRTMLATLLRKHPALSGLDILDAVDGESGLVEYRAHRPGVVIIDLLMPRMDGFSLAQAIRAEPDGHRPTLLITSGIYREAAIANRVKSEYDAEFFAKPYQLKDMVAHVVDAVHADPIDSGPVFQLDLPENGELGERRLPAILLDLHEARASGQLTVRRGRAMKRIDLAFGHPVAVTSNLRDETLGHLLVQNKVITDEQHSRAVQMAATESSRLGAALIEMGLLTPESLVEHLSDQLRYKLVQSLRWPDGQWSLVRAQPSVAHGAEAIDLRQLVIAGLRETFNPNRTPHLERIEQRPLQATERTESLLLVGDAVCPGFAAAWHDGATPRKLLEEGLDRLKLYRALDVLILCDGARASGRIPTGDIDAEIEEISITELSEHSSVKRLPRDPGDNDELYSLLFDEPTAYPTGSDPLEVHLDEAVPDFHNDPDSGFIDMRGLSLHITEKTGDDDGNTEASSARRKLLAEYLRIQNRDHYEVLEIDRDASAAKVAAAVTDKRNQFSMDWFSRFDLGRDYAKLEELHAAYARAFEVLRDDDRRHSYDQELAGDELVESAPSLQAELDFRMGSELLAARQYAAALAKLEGAVEAAPNEADYHAALGWAVFLAGDRTERAADAARPHLSHALAIDPDHALAHEHKGVITAELGNDDTEAAFHLERALDGDPGRPQALAALEQVWRRRGELRPLERQYRKLIYRAAGSDTRLELDLWTKLGHLYRNDLDDLESARIAFQTAAQLDPENRDASAALASVVSGGQRLHERLAILREQWRRDPTSPEPGLEMMRAAEEAGHHDAAYVAASALVARGHDLPDALEMYQRFRPRFVVRAQRQLDADVWENVRHPNDSPAIGAVFALITPTVEAIAPLPLAHLEVDESHEIAEEDLPRALVRVRSYVAHMLGVDEPRVFVRTDFGHQIHVGAVTPPILLAGDDALAAPERSELSFRLSRAMTYLGPGRTLGGSRPGSFLKQAMLAAFSLAAPDAPVSDDPTMLAIREALQSLGPATRHAIAERVAALTRDSPSLNLSGWARALARTADRVGLLLCGDLPAAIRFARDTAAAGALEDLIAYTVSKEHLAARAGLGLSIDV